MTKLEQLKENRKNAWDAAKAFLEQRADNDGLLSDEDKKTYDEMEAKVKAYSEQISRMEAAEAMERELNKPTSKPLTSQPNNTLEDTKPKRVTATKEYANAMLDAFRSNFRRVSNILQEGVDADGGYLVPDEYDSRLIDALNENNIVRQLATQIQTSGQHKINVAATKPAASWIEEGQELKFEDATFSQVILDAHKLHIGVKVTNELLYDNAFNLEDYLMNEFGTALGNAEEDAFLNGTGSGSPTGIFAATGGGTLFKTLSADITASDLIDLEYALKRPYRKNAVFIMNDKTVAKVRKLLYDGSKEFIWQPSLQAGEPATLLGYKVYTSPYAPEDAIAFGDFSYYNIGDRGSRTFSTLYELFVGNDMTGFIAKERVDGKVVLPEAIQILKLKPAAAAAKTAASSSSTNTAS